MTDKLILRNQNTPPDKETAIIMAILERMKIDVLGGSQVSDASLRETTKSWIAHLRDHKIPIDQRLMQAYSDCLTSESGYIGLSQILTMRRKTIERDAQTPPTIPNQKIPLENLPENLRKKLQERENEGKSEMDNSQVDE